MEEIWKDIAGYEGLYQVSNLGNVKSLNYHRSGNQKVLSPANGPSGYFTVRLTKDGKGASKFVHKLVAIAFLENQDGKLCVNHKDGNKHNNRLENLEWATHQENTVHALRTGLRASSTKFAELVHSKGFTSASLSEKVGIPVRTMEGYMCGRRTLGSSRADFFCKLAKALEVDCYHLLEVDSPD